MKKKIFIVVVAIVVIISAVGVFVIFYTSYNFPFTSQLPSEENKEKIDEPKISDTGASPATTTSPDEGNREVEESGESGTPPEEVIPEEEIIPKEETPVDVEPELEIPEVEEDPIVEEVIPPEVQVEPEPKTPTPREPKGYIIEFRSFTDVRPADLTIYEGDTVTFINLDDELHWPGADPHPTHSSLPLFDGLGGISPGQSYSHTFTTSGIYRYHDHLPEDPPTLGTIIVLPSE